MPIETKMLLLDFLLQKDVGLVHGRWTIPTYSVACLCLDVGKLVTQYYSRSWWFYAAGALTFYTYSTHETTCYCTTENFLEYYSENNLLHVNEFEQSSFYVQNIRVHVTWPNFQPQDLQRSRILLYLVQYNC